MNNLSRFEDEASKDWKLTKEQLKKTKLKIYKNYLNKILC